MKSVYDIHKKFLLNEGIEEDVESRLQGVFDAVINISPSTQQDERRKNYALSQLRKIRNEVKKMKKQLREFSV